MYSLATHPIRGEPYRFNLASQLCAPALPTSPEITSDSLSPPFLLYWASRNERFRACERHLVGPGVEVELTEREVSTAEAKPLVGSQPVLTDDDLDGIPPLLDVEDDIVEKAVKSKL
ncbi:hypothetical protein V5O48_009385 [Marasmius crinis-equi]|uniref:Uncharacterized protein n=1 Tax=Marasmius crinis-equi TaxID=585013 RepID=A0ABR3FBW4_9AGAR